MADRDLTFSGTQVPLIVKHNLDCPTYVDILDASDNIVVHNGIIMVDTAFATDFKSFTALVNKYPALDGMVLNMNTGELRLYTAGEYIDPLFDSVAVSQSCDYNISTTLNPVHGVGNRLPQDLKQSTVKYEGNIEKSYSAVNKVASPDGVTPNPIGFVGIEGIIDYLSSTQNKREGYTPYFMIIFYARDHSTNGTITGNTTIFPCAKFENVNPKNTADGIFNETIKFQSLDMIHAPRDTYQEVKYDLDEGQ